MCLELDRLLLGGNIWKVDCPLGSNSNGGLFSLKNNMFPLFVPVWSTFQGCDCARPRKVKRYWDCWRQERQKQGHTLQMTQEIRKCVFLKAATRCRWGSSQEWDVTLGRGTHFMSVQRHFYYASISEASCCCNGMGWMIYARELLKASSLCARALVQLHSLQLLLEKADPITDRQHHMTFVLCIWHTVLPSNPGSLDALSKSLRTFPYTYLVMGRLQKARYCIRVIHEQRLS